MLKVSTGFKTKILGAHSFAALFNGGGIYVYSGARPSSPDVTAPTSPIAAISRQGLAWNPSSIGYGLTFAQNGPYIYFATTDAQLVPNVAATAAWWRLVAPGDDNEPSYTQCRIDGDVGLQTAATGQELLLPALDLALGTAYPAPYFLYTIPPIIGA